MSASISVLLVDDNEQFLVSMARLLTHRGYVVETASSLSAALELQHGSRPAAVLLDHAMPGTTSVQSLTQLRAADPTVCILVLSGEIDVPQTVDAIHAGADSVLTKPPDLDMLFAALERGLRHTSRLRRDSIALAMARDTHGFLNGSPAAQRLLRQIEQVALRDMTVLLVGESGTGRRALAEMIHRLSRQSRGAFTSIAMSKRSETELLSVLAGARREVHRMREVPGTWFLNDMGLMSSAVQTAVLQLIEVIAETTAGSEQPPLRPRLVVSTQRDLYLDSQEKRLSGSMLSALRCIPIAVPALRERGPLAIMMLADSILERWRIDIGIGPTKFDDDARSMLGAFPWPRNVGQLQDVVVQSAFRAGERDTISLADIMPSLRPNTSGDVANGGGVADGVPSGSNDEDWSLQAMERRHIAAVLAMTDGHRTRSARLLGVSRTTLYKKIEELGLGDSLAV